MSAEPALPSVDATPNDQLLEHTAGGVTAARALSDLARERLSARVKSEGRVSASALEAAQYGAHTYAWMATYAEALAQLHDWAVRLHAAGDFGEMEALILRIGFGEYLWQMYGGIPMSQGEIGRPQDIGLSQDDQRVLMTDAVQWLTQQGNSDAARLRLAALMAEREGAASFGTTGLDEEYEMIRDQFRRFADDRVIPDAHGWHMRDELIPIEIVEEMSELGVFGLTIPEEHGGLGMGKTAMCVVSEELSRGYIGVGSLGTRSEIAAELILGGGTDAQKAHYLPKIACGEILPTAVFTEPNTGSDLGALKTRAARDGDEWVLTGNKTWITHAGRTDLMTVLARTDPSTSDYRGLSMFLAPKTRGDADTPFPDATIAGGEIEVLGYRGMKEYTLALDGHRIPADALLGGEEGQGVQATHANVRIGANPDRGACDRGRAGRYGSGPALRPGPPGLWQAADRLPARRLETRHDGGRDHDGPPTHLLLGARKGSGSPLRSGSRDGETAGRACRMGRR